MCLGRNATKEINYSVDLCSLVFLKSWSVFLTSELHCSDHLILFIHTHTHTLTSAKSGTYISIIELIKNKHCFPAFMYSEIINDPKFLSILHSCINNCEFILRIKRYNAYWVFCAISSSFFANSKSLGPSCKSVVPQDGLLTFWTSTGWLNLK